MSMKKGQKGSKDFTDQEKLSILAEAKEKGVNVTLAKYDIYYATLNYWRTKFKIDESSGTTSEVIKKQRAELKRLEKENEQLKILLAERELESKLKDELIKKKYPEMRKKR